VSRSKDATPEQRREQAQRLIQRCIDDAKGQHARAGRDRTNLENTMFWRGGEEGQWSVFHEDRKQFVPRPFDGEAGLPAYVPRCVTNMFAVHVDGIASLLNQSVPGKTYVPMTDDEEDRATAEVAEDAVPVLEDEIGYASLKPRINQLITLIDKVAVVYYFDADEKHGTEPVPLLRCQEEGCGKVVDLTETGGVDLEAMRGNPEVEPETVCPHCGSTNLAVDVDPTTFIPEHVNMPRGKFCADLWSSFEFSLPSTATVADEQQSAWVLGHQDMPIEQACRLWPDYAEAIRQQTGRSRTGSLAAQYATTLRGMSGPHGNGTSSRGTDNMVTVYRLQHDPVDEPDLSLPEGLHGVMVGEVLVEEGPLPLVDENGRPQKSIIIRTFATAPHSPHGKPPADDLVPMQKSRNRVESLIELILMHCAAPTTWLPASVTLEDTPSGAPGAFNRFRSLTPGDHPITERGQNPPEGLYKRLEQIDASMEKVSRLNAVLMGDRPSGDPTLGEVEIMQERGMAAFRTPLDHAIEFEKRQARLLLQYARQSAWAPRFRRVKGENGQWEISQFTNADLLGQVDIAIEPMSAWPKSPAMQLVRIQKAVEFGILQPAADPEVALRLLTEMALGEFKKSTNEDKRQVARELDRWKAAQGPADIPPPLPDPLINLPLHLLLKTTFLKGEQAEAIAAQNPPVFEAMLAHVQQLQQRMQPPAPPAEPTGPDGAAVEQAVQSGALVPAGAQPQANPLEAAVQSGALLPAGAAPPQGPTGPSIDELTANGVMTPLVPVPAGGGATPPPASMGRTSTGGLR
jgi:hypothetical protein